MSRSQLHRPAAAQPLGADDTGCSILHVDMDAFYASVSLLARPDLVGRPVIIGGSANRGVVLSATYEARALGVHSAMPVGRARRIAPSAIVIEPDYARYSQTSAGVMALFSSITPQVEPLSLDEAFLDVSGAQRRLGSPRQIAERIRAQVFDEQGITCSVGVAASKFVAKLASTLSKPDGLLVIPPDRVIEFLHPLPVDALWGVGDKTAETLHRLGLRTVGDIAATPVRTLCRVLGQSAGQHLSELSWGRDARQVVPHEPDRSIGAEETFGTDVDDSVVLRRELLRLSEKVAARMRAKGVVGRTVQLKVRFADFTTLTRSRTLPDPTDVGREVYQTVGQLFTALDLQRARVRLVGVRVSGLVDEQIAPQQLLLDAGPGWRDAEQAVDRIAARFGRDAVKPARLVVPPP